MNYKALITDIDGTLVPIGADASAVTKQMQTAVGEAIGRGYKIACASGRDRSLLQDILTKLGVSDPCVIDGGSRIIDPASGETLWQKTLESGASQQILRIFKEHSPQGILITSNSDERPVVGQVENVQADLSYIYLLNIDLASAELIRNEVNNRTPHSIGHITPSWYGEGRVDIHVTHREATKSHGIRVWHEMVGVSVAETIGMGDSGNDMPLMQAAGLKIAVGNATPEIKQVADYIAPNVKDDPLSHVIDKFFNLPADKV